MIFAVTSGSLIESRLRPSEPTKTTRPKTIPSTPLGCAATAAIPARPSKQVEVSLLDRKSVSSSSSSEKTSLLGRDVLLECVRRLDHRRDDVPDADLVGLEQVADRLASADLHRQRKPRSPRDVDKTEALVHARALGLELRLDVHYPIELATLLQEVGHLAFGRFTGGRRRGGEA